MKITIHRGQNQIGGCITEIESGSGTRILIDLGHNLPEGDTPSEDKYDIPENMDELLKGCSAVLYTHYHGDHLGFAAEVHKRGIPQYMGRLAIDIMQHLNSHMRHAEALRTQAEANLEALKDFREIVRNHKTVIGDISITPYNVSHSAPDSYMFLIECDGKKILHTGDFRDHGYLGKGLSGMLNKYIIPKGIDILITEGTNVGQPAKSIVPENEIQQEFHRHIRKYKNVFILCSSADMDRLWSIYQAHTSSKPIVCDSYQKEMFELFAHSNNDSEYLYRFDCNRIYDYKAGNTKLIEWMKDRGFTMLIRKSDKFQKIIDQIMPFCKNDETCIIYSMFKGYITSDHKAYNDSLFEFVKQFPNFEYCHTSGHASKEALESLLCMINPNDAIIPIHTESGSAFADFNIPEHLKERICVENVISF